MAQRQAEALRTVKTDVKIKISFVIQGCALTAAFDHTFSGDRIEEIAHAILT